MDDKEYKIDIAEFQKQQTEHIKKSGHYLELNILIGTEKDEKDGGSTPVITTCMHGCGPREIAELYKSLEVTREHLRKEHPMECLMADVMMGTREIGSYSTKLPHDDEEE